MSIRASAFADCVHNFWFPQSLQRSSLAEVIAPPSASDRATSATTASFLADLPEAPANLSGDELIDAWLPRGGMPSYVNALGQFCPTSLLVSIGQQKNRTQLQSLGPRGWMSLVISLCFFAPYMHIDSRTLEHLSEVAERAASASISKQRKASPWNENGLPYRQALLMSIPLSQRPFLLYPLARSRDAELRAKYESEFDALMRPTVSRESLQRVVSIKIARAGTGTASPAEIMARIERGVDVLMDELDRALVLISKLRDRMNELSPPIANSS